MPRVWTTVAAPEAAVTLDGLEMTIGIQRQDDARPSGRHTDTDEA